MPKDIKNEKRYSLNQREYRFIVSIARLQSTDHFHA